MTPKEGSEFYLSQHYSNPANTIELVAFSLMPAVRESLRNAVMEALVVCRNYIPKERMKTMKKVVADHFPREILEAIPQEIKDGKGNKVIVVENVPIPPTSFIKNLLRTEGERERPDYLIGEVALGIRGHFLECTEAEASVVARKNHETMPFGDFWHQDTTHTSIFSCVLNEAVKMGASASTQFVDGSEVYKKLSDGLRHRVFLNRSEISKGTFGAVNLKYIKFLETRYINDYAMLQAFSELDNPDKTRNNPYTPMQTEEKGLLERIKKDKDEWERVVSFCSFNYELKTVDGGGDMAIWPNKGIILHRSVATKGIETLGEDDVVRAAIFTGGHRRH